MVTIPLTHNEFCAVCPAEETPDYFETLIKNTNIPECPYVREYTVPDDSTFILVNGSQKYVPVTTTVPELVIQLANVEQPEWQRIISSTCCPIEDYLRLAAATNNLHLIDDTFYKKYLNESVWSFDRVPECLKDAVQGPGKIRIKRQSDSTDGVVTLYGQEFVLV